MQQILILGVGRSTYYLLKYLHDVLIPTGIRVKAIDLQQALIDNRQQEFPAIHFMQSEINPQSIAACIRDTDLVVSMLPPAFHLMVAELCIQQNKHFFTASYVSPEIKALHEEAKKRDLLFLMECGLDPGIDHMSALSLIDTLKSGGAAITSFESFTGGLVHPSYTNPPWNYKVSWNPRNVVLAGQGNPAQYLKDGTIQSVPYNKLFMQPSSWKLSGEQIYEGYPNRDSLNYRSLYALEQAGTFVRGTLRYPGYCFGWNCLIHLGLTDDTNMLPEDPARTGRSFLKDMLSVDDAVLEKELPGRCANNADALKYIQALGLFNETPIYTGAGTAAQILQTIIEQKWKMLPADKDRIVMIHRIKYNADGKKHVIQSSLVVDGEDAERTAMAKTVGLPLAIAIDLFLHNRISLRGVVIPVTKELYGPILQKLTAFGVVFNERNE
jgi:saccharopine dehydrogenase-like NADP-dependent oxidoreductase